jgi:hypothetical protein
LIDHGLQLSLHGCAPADGYEPLLREVVKILTERLPAAAYIADITNTSHHDLRAGGRRTFAAGKSNSPRVAVGIAVEQVEKSLKLDERGGTINLDVADRRWRSSVGVLKVGFLDYLRFDCTIHTILTPEQLPTVPLEVVDELVSFAEVAASRFELWNGWVSTGQNWLEAVNGFDWYKSESRAAVSSYSWSVLASPDARSMLDHQAIATADFDVATIELAGASKGAAIYRASVSPICMDDAQLRQWRSIFAPAIPPPAHAANKNVLISERTVPAGIVVDDWQPVVVSN